VKVYGGYTYLLSNKTNTVLYAGVTENLTSRVYQHKHNLVLGFTAKYHIHKLVWYEHYERIQDAILREKQIKGGSRKKKIELIEQMNPEWNDLYDDLLK